MCEVEGVDRDKSKELLDVLSSKDAKGHTDLAKVRATLKENEEALAQVDETRANSFYFRRYGFRR